MLTFRDMRCGIFVTRNSVMFVFLQLSVSSAVQLVTLSDVSAVM